MFGSLTESVAGCFLSLFGSPTISSLSNVLFTLLCQENINETLNPSPGTQRNLQDFEEAFLRFSVSRSFKRRYNVFPVCVNKPIWKDVRTPFGYQYHWRLFTLHYDDLSAFICLLERHNNAFYCFVFTHYDSIKLPSYTTSVAQSFSKFLWISRYTKSLAPKICNYA